MSKPIDLSVYRENKDRAKKEAEKIFQSKLNRLEKKLEGYEQLKEQFHNEASIESLEMLIAKTKLQIEELKNS